LRPPARFEAKKLDAALLAVLRRRNREPSVFPGFPFALFNLWAMGHNLFNVHDPSSGILTSYGTFAKAQQGEPLVKQKAIPALLVLLRRGLWVVTPVFCQMARQFEL
jgi:hypothetical protein